MNFFRRHFANMLTLGNLFSGCVGAVFLLKGAYEVTAICIVISLVLDFFDGFAARALRTDSLIGVQLDSLADVVSFGFLPGLTLYMALERFGNEFFGLTLPFDLKYLGFFVTLFSALRLAIFNLDLEQRYYFKGLNTPTNTLFLFSLFYAYKQDYSYSLLFNNPVLIILLIIISSWLLISPLKMISLKFKSKLLKDNYPKLAVASASLLLLLFFGLKGLPIAVVSYILISLLYRKDLTQS